MQIMQVEQLRKMDEEALAMGFPTILLMDHAANALYEHVKRLTKGRAIQRICIVCGGGNNGGDGLALARLFHGDKHFETQILCTKQEEDFCGDAKIFAQIAKQLAIPWFHEIEIKQWELRLQEADVIVDCLFGTGLRRNIEGFYAELITLINEQDAYVLSADIPSGIDGDHGTMLRCAVKADATVTFVTGKLGLYMGEGLRHSGHVEIADIHMPPSLMNKQQAITLLDTEQIHTMLLQRARFGHKGTFGKGLVIGGAVGMSGAVVMVAQGALRSGIGTMSAMVPQASQPVVAGQCMELMTLPIAMKSDHLDETQFRERIAPYDVIAFGNGMGRTTLTKAMLDILWHTNKPCIFDGDALYYLHKYANEKREAMTVLTPHPKEVSYLLGISPKEKEKNPLETLKTLNKTFPRCTVVMKNASTLISDGEQNYLNCCGNDGLASGGSGDVLCGIILGLMGQRMDALTSACVGVYAHAFSGEEAAKKMSTRAMLPRDILAQLAKTWLMLEQE